MQLMAPRADAIRNSQVIRETPGNQYSEPGFDTLASAAIAQLEEIHDEIYREQTHQMYISIVSANIDPKEH